MMNDRVIGLLEELVVWTRFAARGPLDEVLRQALTDPRHQAAYEATDGERTQQQVADVAGIDQTTVSDLWSRWRRLGLVRDGARRPARLISLADLGWEVPSGGSRRRSRGGSSSG
jgi:CRP-like cAMP-binding protein